MCIEEAKVLCPLRWVWGGGDLGEQRRFAKPYAYVSVRLPALNNVEEFKDLRLSNLVEIDIKQAVVI